MVAPAPEAVRIAVGVAGWSYADWDGYVYGPDTKDQLAFVARFVDMVEINSTFYRPPSAPHSASWIRRTEFKPDFFFTAKLHQDVTHAGKIAPDMVRAFREGLRPLTDTGRLRHLLAQFKYDFADTPGTRDHLRRIKDCFGDMACLTLEFRHISWQKPTALSFVENLGVSVASLDYPIARNSFNMRASSVGRDAYLRLHGRNVKAWFSKGAGRDEVYNYLYSAQEVSQIAARALEIAKMSATLTVVANNHYQGKEMVTALQLKAWLSGGRVPVPPILACRYPELKDIAA